VISQQCVIYTAQWQFRNSGVFDSAVAKPYTAEDSSVLGCDTVLGEYFLRAL